MTPAGDAAPGSAGVGPSDPHLEADLAAPWSLEGEAVVTLARPVPCSGARGSPQPPSLVVAARYRTSPVGPYLELVLAEPARRGVRVGLTVTTMAVDSRPSLAAGRRIWGFPKEMAMLSWTADGEARGLEWEDRGVRVTAHPRALPSFPVLVPLRFLQHHDGATVVIPGRLHARARLADVSVEGGAGTAFHAVAGHRPGLLLADLRLLVGPRSG